MTLVYEDGLLIGGTYKYDELELEDVKKGTQGRYYLELLGEIPTLGLVSTMRRDRRTGALKNPRMPGLTVTHEMLYDTGAEDTSLFQTAIDILDPGYNLPRQNQSYRVADGRILREQTIRQGVLKIWCYNVAGHGDGLSRILRLHTVYLRKGTGQQHW